MIKGAFEDWSDSSMKKTNHGFMSSEPDNQPIRHLSEQLSILAPVEPATPVAPLEPRDTAPEAPVEPVNCYWNTSHTGRTKK